MLKQASNMNSVCIEELPEILSENPAVKLIAFAHLFHRRPILETTDLCCKTIREARGEENARFKIDRVTNDAIKRAIFECQIVMDDLQDDLLDRQNLEAPEVIHDLRRGLL